MALTTKDLASIKLPAAVLIGALVVAYLIVDLSAAERDRTEAQLLAQIAGLRDAQQRFHRSGEEQATIERYLPAYKQLEKEGLIGAEQRVDWIDGLRSANERAGLLGVDYQLSAQQPFTHLAQTNPMAQKVRHSQMKLSFGLAHEGELMRFIRALAAQRAGLFALTGCSLDRSPGIQEPTPRQANLKAECEISWLTIEPDGGKT